jgi:hypothetical protein
LETTTAAPYSGMAPFTTRSTTSTAFRKLNLRDVRFKKRRGFRVVNKSMALREVDRVALYWPESAMRKLLDEAKVGCHAPPKCSRPSDAEILRGGCLLYRIFDRPLGFHKTGK